MKRFTRIFNRYSPPFIEWGFYLLGGVFGVVKCLMCITSQVNPNCFNKALGRNQNNANVPLHIITAPVKNFNNFVIYNLNLDYTKVRKVNVRGQINFTVTITLSLTNGVRTVFEEHSARGELNTFRQVDFRVVEGHAL